MLGEIAAYIPYFKYWTEDPKEWDAILKEAFDTLDEGIRDEDIDLRVSRAGAYGVFHLSGNFLFNQPVAFKEPGGYDIQDKYLDRAEKHGDPLVRVSAYEVFIRFDGSEKYSQKLLDTCLRSSDSPFIMNIFTVFPGVADALEKTPVQQGFQRRK